jgi:Lon protease-like protein
MLLAIFPLAVVLLPRNLLPLHIFEDRYKEMIGAVLEADSEFGVVLAAKDGIARVGCSAAIERVLERYEDGRMDILTAGRRRFEIQSLDQEKSYLRAEVEYFDDEEIEAPGELRQRAVTACADLPSEDDLPDLEDPLLSFRLAQRLDDADFRQQLLISRSEPDRLRRIIQFAPGYAGQLRRVAHMKEVAPQNGHGRLPVGSKEV